MVNQQHIMTFCNKISLSVHMAYICLCVCLCPYGVYTSVSVCMSMSKSTSMSAFVGLFILELSKLSRHAAYLYSDRLPLPGMIRQLKTIFYRVIW